jgi:hypothetical protein
MSKVIKVCKTCGSENVLKDAWAKFNPEIQEWVLENIFDNEYCEECENETTIIDKEITTKNHGKSKI